MMGSTMVLFSGIFFALLLTDALDPKLEIVFQIFTYGLFTAGLLCFLGFAISVRGKVAGGEMDAFDVFLALRDGALRALTSGVLANVIGGFIYVVFRFFTQTQNFDFETLTYLFLGFGTMFTLFATILAIAFEHNAIRAARAMGVTS